jgi:hypothetical protein
MAVRLMVDSSGIGFAQAGEYMKGKLDVFLVQKNDRGNQFNGTDDKIELTLNKDQYAKAMQSGAIILPDRAVPLVPQASQLRIVVRDDASGTLGSVTVPLKSAAGKSQPNLIKR